MLQVMSLALKNYKIYSKITLKRIRHKVINKEIRKKRTFFKQSQKQFFLYYTLEFLRKSKGETQI